MFGNDFYTLLLLVKFKTKMGKIIFKHKKTEDFVIKKGEDFFLMKDDCISDTIIPTKIITNGSDWECITDNGRESYVLL